VWYSFPVAYLRGALGHAPKIFWRLYKCRLKRRLTGKFGYLIVRKVTKFVATRCQILRPKCTKINVGPRWGAYSAPKPLAGFKGPTSKAREGKGWGMGEERRRGG